ncbi:tetraacyldisaccharide 4'-kinase [Marinomonas sp. M1K-6]|uniref:Tetraacyldisaccharide 4'-kinase n=1 Tax=Marinomonas profundi TaxID=2726122 RepID=A0A847QUR8_9GAMM|nr:tetraacyldisaccharide 4'-kinase [Marinomonas profundi]NLQ16298.1 tetraacyldisaccharide 4'-kinase [Marinomonas profundi]UDV03126.1 tetraacyldisaccharide 4'-kinase [Marinomonas profundi]
MSVESLFTRSWYGRCGWTNVFRPLQPLIRRLVLNKRRAFLEQSKKSYRAPVPVVVVGNISVGGTGKSPMVVALCQLLKAHGYRPGIVSRGHGAKITVPTPVYPESSTLAVGDEPVMLVRRAACPMVVFSKRDEAVKYLLATTDVDVVISDDGMQHYQLNRDIEVAMLDAKRGVGNGQLLPVGPLREPVERLKEVDFVVSVSHEMTDALEKLSLPITLAPLIPSRLMSLDGARRLDCQQAFVSHTKWHIMAGIGNPERFIDTLEQLGLQKKHTTHQWFADHHAFDKNDIPADRAIIMTEKDAVKCQSLSVVNENIWYLPVSLQLPECFQHAFLEKLNLIKVDH